MLEVGCGKGALLSVARERRWDVAGVEISADAAQIAKAKGLNVYVGPVEKVLPLTEPADFVHMNHVLGHVADPLRVLKLVYDSLKPDGIAIIEVPNEFGNLFSDWGAIYCQNNGSLTRFLRRIRISLRRRRCGNWSRLRG